MKTRVAGAIHDVNRMTLRIGGKNRRATRWIGNVGGETVLLASFVQPLSVTAGDVQGTSRTGQNPLTTAKSTAVPTGGLAPFTYQWAMVSGTATINSPTSASTTFTRAVTVGAPGLNLSARVTVTDAQGTTATHDISVYFQSDYITGGGTA